MLTTSPASSSDPGLLKKHTRYEGYTTASGHTYPKIRTFYKQHQQESELPKDLPLLVFVHGLGGSASQFAPLLTSLINLAPCLAIDLPGCGLSEFEPSRRDAYTTRALAELVAAAISRFRNAENGQKIILVGHSMGCAISALLASSASSLSRLLEGQIIGVIAICPRGTSLAENEATAIRRLRWIPVPLFDLFRWYDRRGGLCSPSVTRVVGKGADEETRTLQLKYNDQSQSRVFMCMAVGAAGEDGLPGKDVWSGIQVPLFLVAGEADNITPAREAEQIAAWLTGSCTPNNTSSEPQRREQIKVPPIPTTTGDAAAAEKKIPPDGTETDKPRTSSGSVIKDTNTSTTHSHALKTTIFPAPASHGLLYSSSTVRILSGMLENFLSQHVDARLGLGWQLSHLTTSGKWDVKNVKKWQSVEPCSGPIGGIFRAMKTMREVDPEHCPKEFVKSFSSAARPDGVAVVVDISHESPVYHPRGLEDAGVQYHKFPTVSKEKPKAEEVDRFIRLVDDLLQTPKLQPAVPTPPAANAPRQRPRPTIAVHCHYGYNRTGFFIICYLVERLHYQLSEAIEEFTRKRAPGIKHEHFVNELYVRYAVKMERRGGTLEVE